MKSELGTPGLLNAQTWIKCLQRARPVLGSGGMKETCVTSEQSGTLYRSPQSGKKIVGYSTLHFIRHLKNEVNLRGGHQAGTSLASALMSPGGTGAVCLPGGTKTVLGCVEL